MYNTSIEYVQYMFSKYVYNLPRKYIQILMYICTYIYTQLPAKPTSHPDLYTSYSEKEKEKRKRDFQRPKAARPPAGISTTLVSAVYFAWAREMTL